MPRHAERLLPAAYALLGLLAEGPAHGYELHRAFAAEGPLADIYRLEINQLYALLKKLDDLRLVEATGFAPVGNTPPRRSFAITPAGLAELNDMCRSSTAAIRCRSAGSRARWSASTRRGPTPAVCARRRRN